MPRGRKAVPSTIPEAVKGTKATVGGVDRPTDRHWMIYDLVRVWVSAGMGSGVPLKKDALDEIYDGAEHLVGRILSNG